jgi:hypothetical protein
MKTAKSSHAGSYLVFLTVREMRCHLLYSFFFFVQQCVVIIIFFLWLLEGVLIYTS